MFDHGAGAPLLVIPGIQGRWEWMRPMLNALAKNARVLSYSLRGDIGSRMPMDRALGFDAYVAQIDRVLDEAGVLRAAVCGVSYGGVIAVRYAAVRPDRVSHLIVVSSPGPGWEPSERQKRYAARPWLSMPAFCLTARQRLGAEMRATFPDLATRTGFMLGYAVSALTAPMMPHLMSERVRLQQGVDGRADCARVRVPTLVVTGEPSLDQVVPVSSTREYVGYIRGARYVMMDRTGHLGSLTQPDRFAGIVKEFLAANS